VAKESLATVNEYAVPRVKKTAGARA